MPKRNVFIAVHQLNVGGVQKALISALDAIDYTENDVTLYVRRNRLDLIDSVNKGVSKIIVNRDNTDYNKKPYSLWLQLRMKLRALAGRDFSALMDKNVEYITGCREKAELKLNGGSFEEYDLAIAYIQNTTAEFVSKNIKAKRKVMFYHGSTDEAHEIHEKVMGDFERIYCVSKGALDCVKKLYPQFADKMDYLSNCVDYIGVRSAAKQFVPDYPSDKITLCSCGRITKVKGFDLAVETAKRLRDNGTDFVWYFVGDGAEREKTERLIDLYSLGENIVITGMQSNPYPYIENCDIFVQPSYEEAHPLTIIEAKILLAAVVTTNTAGGADIIKDGEDGLVADINPDSLCEKITLLINNKALYGRIKQRLKEIDYSLYVKKFRGDWRALLEGKQ